MAKGTIGVTTENIFPIIKKFLYSDHEIFLRELISNAVDATQKLRTLASKGEYQSETGNTTIEVKLDAKAKTLTVSDKGIGMTQEEVEKFINQIAFSSAGEFMEKYKGQENAIIGHFGLGFYSSFMVSEKVEIFTRSYREESKAVHWECDGSPEYSLTEIDKAERGTDIVLHIDAESAEFLEEDRIHNLLKKYCKFLPVEIAFGVEKEWKDGKQVETDKPRIINDTRPAWTRKPADLSPEDYKKFYRDLYPANFDEPLFWIHLNVDYPFNLTGILYFPKIRNNFEVQKNKIQLYCNQVFVTDSVEGIVPDFLTLLHGVIDSPDIPLNVSRSYLQSDSNVKKISGHITKKVSDRLLDIFKENREDFEKKWDDLKMFIEYGIISDEKFQEKAVPFTLVKNTDGKYFSIEEYEELVKANQTDAEKKTVFLYASGLEDQFSFIDAAKNKGYDVLIMDGYLDSHFINHIEQKNEKIKFVRVDSNVPEKLISKEKPEHEMGDMGFDEEVQHIFEGWLPEKKGYFHVKCEAMGDSEMPVYLTQEEWMRRMKDMSAIGGGMNFYGNMPDSFNLIVNTNHPLVVNILKEKEESLGQTTGEIRERIKALEADLDALNTLSSGKKDEEIPQEEKDKKAELYKQTEELNGQLRDSLKNFGHGNKIVKQLVDLALLSNNMLKGEDLNHFLKRSVELIKA